MKQRRRDPDRTFPRPSWHRERREPPVVEDTTVDGLDLFRIPTKELGTETEFDWRRKRSVFNHDGRMLESYQE